MKKWITKATVIAFSTLTAFQAFAVQITYNNGANSYETTIADERQEQYLSRLSKLKESKECKIVIDDNRHGFDIFAHNKINGDSGRILVFVQGNGLGYNYLPDDVTFTSDSYVMNGQKVELITMKVVSWRDNENIYEMNVLVDSEDRILEIAYDNPVPSRSMRCGAGK